MSVTASAAKPEINHFSFTGVNEEASADLTEFCGFPISVFEDTRATERSYPDGTLRDTVHQRITYTAGSQQLFERNSFRIQDESGRSSSRTAATWRSTRTPARSSGTAESIRA